ncbi:MAG: branched-chain amino acid transport system permease protein [Actinomycetota bacterium]|nr:branched-chain amino acid transport system permease protein [Actinomycetota bacterium]
MEGFRYTLAAFAVQSGGYEGVNCNTAALGDLIVTGITLGSVYALIALGYTMVYGVLKLINFAHDSIFMIGAAAAYYLFVVWFGWTEEVSGIGLIVLTLVGLMFSALASGGAALTLERLAYRPLRRRGAARLSFLIAAVGASFFVTYLFQQEFLLGTAEHNFGSFMPSTPIFEVIGSPLNRPRLLLILGAVVMFIVLDRFVRTTRTGRSIRAVSEDIDAARMMGVNVDRVVATTFFIGGFFGGIAGFLYALVFRKVAWNLGFIPGIKAFTSAVLGGIGNLRGAVLGGLLLGLIENLSTICIGSEWRNVVAFSVLVLVLIFRPTGVLGEGLAK